MDLRPSEGQESVRYDLGDGIGPKELPVISDAFLAAAVQHDFIRPIEIDRIQSYAKSKDIHPSDAALSLAVLATSEVDAIKMLLKPRNLLSGYELTHLVGYGAGGMVFAAEQLALGRSVAVKTISPSVKISNSVARLQREALSIARLKHPNIVSVYDSGFANGRFCIAMELVEGGSLADRLTDRGPLSEQATWLIARQIAAALQHANEEGIIHRDIKPGNILLSDPPAGIQLPSGVPFVKVADFGLALEHENADTQLTATGTGLGTPAYVAPEQIDDSHVDLRADVYAIGATVFHMLTGSEPYAHTSPAQIISQKLVGDDSWRDKISEGFTPETRQLFHDLTSANADRRISNYEELIDRIDEALLFASTTTPDIVSTDLGEIPSSSQDTHAITRTFARLKKPRPNKKRTWVWAASAVAILLGISFGVRNWVQTSPTSKVAMVAVSEWKPAGLPTPLFNGQSVPRFGKTGFWQPTVAADGSRVLTGHAPSRLDLPIAIQDTQHSRLRLAINLKSDDQVLLSTSREGQPFDFLQLTSSEAIHLRPDQEDTKIEFPERQAEVSFQRLELYRFESKLAIVLNGKRLPDLYFDGTSQITLRCVSGKPEFADIDLGRMQTLTGA